MYSGTTFQHTSGNVLGAHQKIDRVARVVIKDVIPKDVTFPTIKEILRFEGNNGPDGIKRKSPAKDEPWHYFNPNDPKDTALIEMIENHMDNLISALAANNIERSAFESSWLAHTIVDGLTPAHHYPLEQKIEELWGKPKDSRLTIKEKNIIKGDTKRDTFAKNWTYWGAKGVWTSHFMFEWGVATIIAPIKMPTAKPDKYELKRTEKEGIIPLFKEAATHIYHLHMYDNFQKNGWSPSLAHQTRYDLVPLITKTVALAWYYAAYRAALGKEANK